jgi:putative acetyltransferase
MVIGNATNSASSGAVTIRRATAGDAAQIHRVYSNPGTYSGTLQLPHAALEIWSERLKAADANRIILVALVDEVIVGTAGLHLEVNLRRRHAAGIGIGIADAFAGQGIGSALLRELLNLADNWLGVLRLELTVFTDNAAAQALYRKSGFVTEGILRGFAMRDGVLADVYAMARLHPNQPLVPPRSGEKP